MLVLVGGVSQFLSGFVAADCGRVHGVQFSQQDGDLVFALVVFPPLCVGQAAYCSCGTGSQEVLAAHRSSLPKY